MFLLVVFGELYRRRRDLDVAWRLSASARVRSATVWPQYKRLVQPVHLVLTWQLLWWQPDPPGGDSASAASTSGNAQGSWSRLDGQRAATPARGNVAQYAAQGSWKWAVR